MALVFDLADDGDKVKLSGASDLQNIWAGGATIMFWFFAPSWGQGSAGSVFEKADRTVDGWKAYVNSAEVVIFQHEHATTFGRWDSGAGSVGLNTWHHCAITWDKDTSPTAPLFHIDGELQTTTVVQAPSGAADSDSGLSFQIGSRIQREFSYDGRLEDMRLYSSILSSATILDIFSSRQRDNQIIDLIRRYPMSPVIASGIALNTPHLNHVNHASVATTATFTVPTNSDGDALVWIAACAGLSSTASVITTPSGWTLEVGQDTPAAGSSTPTISMYSRPASSEPSTYDITSDVGSQGWAGAIINLTTMSTTSIDTLSNSDTTGTPTTPSATPGSNSIAVWAMVSDDGWSLPNVRDQSFPSDARGLTWIAGTNLTVSIAIGPIGSGASGTRVFTLKGSNQWAALTVTFSGGDGYDGPPVIDLSNAKDHAETFYKTRGAEGLR